MTNLRIQRIIFPAHSHFRSCLRRSSTIAHSTVLSETETPFKPYTNVKGPDKSFSEIPGPKGLYNVPYIGTALHFKPFTEYGQSDLSEVFSSLRDRYGDIYSIRMGGNHAVFVSHPDYVEEVFRLPYKEHKRFIVPMQDIFYRRNTISTRGLSILNGGEWAKLRKPVQDKLLRPSHISNYYPLVDDVANDFLEKMKQKQEVGDLYHELLNFTTESIGMLTLNKRFGCLDNTCKIDFYDLFNRIFTTFHESYFMPIQTFRYFRTKMYRDFENNMLALYDFVLGIMKDQTAHLQMLDQEGKLEDYLEKEPNLLYSMLSDDRMTPQQVGSIIIDMYTGAIDSTANGIAFALSHLALHPDKQSRLFEEISRVVGDSNNITNEHLSKMPYLKSCLKESQRLIYPVFLGGVRVMETDVTVAGYRLPKGQHVFLNNEAMCKDERFFPHANEYVPERWLRNQKTESLKACENHPFIVRPFGFGARMCPGQRVAETQSLICIAKMIQNFEVSLPSEVNEIKWKRRVFATPVDKVSMCLKHRHSTTGT